MQRFRLTRTLTALAVILALSVVVLRAADWIQQNGSMVLRAGSTTPLMIVDQRSTGKIASFRYQGTETAFIDSAGIATTGTSYWSNGSNLERAFARWASNVFELGTEANGGTARSMRFIVPSTKEMRFSVDGNSTDILNLNSTGLMFPTDNTYDIGAVAATRPRNFFAGTLIASPIFQVAEGGANNYGFATTVGGSTRTRFTSPARGQFNFEDVVGATVGIGLDFATDANFKVRNRAQNAYATVWGLNFYPDSSGGIIFGNGSRAQLIDAGADGIVKLMNIGSTTGGRIDASLGDGIFRLSNIAGTGYTALILGTNDANGLRITKNTTVFQFLLGDASTYAEIQALRQFLTANTLGTTVQQLTTVATNDDPTEIFFQNRVATTDATVTTLETVTIATSTNTVIGCYITARRTGGVSGAAEDGGGYYIEVVMKNTAGTAAELAAETVRTIGESQAGWNVTSAPSGATELIQVTGAVSNNVTWHSSCRKYAVSS